mmetsp:Transcript_25771/g.56423  ORF Transcript_25771/g.56423 Transcript_25771/m.56423 type:complete len:242 (+) Transcript_25771:413-1138(+)
MPSSSKRSLTRTSCRKVSALWWKKSSVAKVTTATCAQARAARRKATTVMECSRKRSSEAFSTAARALLSGHLRICSKTQLVGESVSSQSTRITAVSPGEGLPPSSRPLSADLLGLLHESLEVDVLSRLALVFKAVLPSLHCDRASASVMSPFSFAWDSRGSGPLQVRCLASVFGTFVSDVACSVVALLLRRACTLGPESSLETSRCLSNLERDDGLLPLSFLAVLLWPCDALLELLERAFS